MSVHVLEHYSPYGSYGLSQWVIDLGSEWTQYEREFTAEGFSGSVDDARLQFWIGPYDGAGSVYDIDNVVLERADIGGPAVSCERIRNGGFEEGTDYWRFSTDASGSFSDQGPNSKHAAEVSILATGKNVQLYQKGLSLWNGQPY